MVAVEDDGRLVAEDPSHEEDVPPIGAVILIGIAVITVMGQAKKPAVPKLGLAIVSRWRAIRAGEASS